MKILDGDGLEKYIDVSGVGSLSSPYKPLHSTSIERNLEAGELFFHSGKHALANGATFKHLIVTPTDKRVQFIAWAIVALDSPMEAYFYEAPLLTAYGTPTVGVNQNRNNMLAHTSLLYEEPTISDNGLKLGEMLMSGGKQMGTTLLSETAWVLDFSTAYLINVKNVSGVATTITVSFHWIES
ncbi:MAG: hypothetical protein BWK79_00135 [Beggiatoa sp. IS2]|nr:MAG: hypothetical protein BWK79_00135 [Beggiatoa sp. IS2]